MKYAILFLLLTAGALAQDNHYAVARANDFLITCVDTQWVTPAGKIYKEVKREIYYNPYVVLDSMRYYDDPGPCGNDPVTIIMDKGCPICGTPKLKTKCVPQYAHVECLNCGAIFSGKRCE